MTLHRTISYLALWMLLGPAVTRAQPPVENKPQDYVVVFRLAGKLLEETVAQEIQQDVPIATTVLDAWCEGSGTATAQVSMDFAAAKLDEPLPIEFHGRLDVRSRGYTDPVVVTADTTTTFQGQVLVDFDGGKFVYVSEWAAAEGLSTVVCIQPRRGGLVGDLIRSVARRQVPQQVPRYDAAGARLAEQQIVQAAAAGAQPVIAELNKRLRIEQTLAALITNQGYERVVTKTDTYLQSRVAAVGRADPVPPTDDLVSESPIEIWVYPNSRRILLGEIALKWQQAERLARQIPGLDVPKPPLSEDVEISVMGDWDLIRIGRLGGEAE